MKSPEIGIQPARVDRLPPRGGSGLKYSPFLSGSTPVSSPSARREWVEMPLSVSILPASTASPSARREWVEITMGDAIDRFGAVSLREEGVG